MLDQVKRQQRYSIRFLTPISVTQPAGRQYVRCARAKAVLSEILQEVISVSAEHQMADRPSSESVRPSWLWVQVHCASVSAEQRPVLFPSVEELRVFSLAAESGCAASWEEP